MATPNKRTIELYAKKQGKNKKTVQKTVEPFQNFEVNRDLLMSCYNAWNSGSTWRMEMRRNERFIYGDQHADRVFDPASGQWKTERQMFNDMGHQPSQYNFIRNILRTISGLWQSNKTLPFCVAQKEENQPESDVLTATLHAHYRKHELRKLRSAQFQQLMVSGVASVDINYSIRKGDADVYSDYIDPFSIFIDNSMKDPRYTDCSLVGYITDMSKDDVIGAFSRGNKARADKIRAIFSNMDGDRIIQAVETFTDDRIERDFFTPETEYKGLCRIIKVWQKENKKGYFIHDYLTGKPSYDWRVTEQELIAENDRRKAEQAAMGVEEEDMLLLEWTWTNQTVWKYYYMTSWGEVLESGINPYWHEMPSILFELHEFYVGKIYPITKDLIDSQKEVNKLSNMSQLLVKHSAKNKLFMPVETIDDENGYGMEYLENTISDFNSIVPYKSQGTNAKPEFINTVAQSYTPLNLINNYLGLTEKVSGVYGALQGAAPTAGTPAQMYAQQTQNSSTALVGIFDTFNSFVQRCDKMIVQMMQQYYKEKRYIYDKKSNKQILWDPDKVRNIDFEISFTENTDTPAYRLLMNDLLFQLKQYDTTNMLDLKGLIEAGDLPFKDKLLDYINKQQQQAQKAMQAGQQYIPETMPPDLQQQIGKTQFNPVMQQQINELAKQEA